MNLETATTLFCRSYNKEKCANIIQYLHWFLISYIPLGYMIPYSFALYLNILLLMCTYTDWIYTAKSNQPCCLTRVEQTLRLIHGRETGRPHKKTDTFISSFLKEKYNYIVPERIVDIFVYGIAGNSLINSVYYLFV